MKITLQPEQEQFIRSQLDAGKYETAEQVIDRALQLLEKWNNPENEAQLLETLEDEALYRVMQETELEIPFSLREALAELEQA